MISYNLDYKISTIARKINMEADGIIPFGLRLKWRNAAEVDSYVKMNEVIVVLRKQDNCDQNIIDACQAFVPKALIPKSRNCIDKKALNALDKYVVRKILSSGTYDSAYNLFMRSIYQPFYKMNPLNTALLESYSALDEIGFFTRVMLEEFRRLGMKLFGTTEEDKFRAETLRFIQFLSNFPNRRPGELTPLRFTGQKICISIILVARKETLDEHGTEAYIHRLSIEIDRGAQRIYFFSNAQETEENIHDLKGNIIKWVRSEFTNINAIETECKNMPSIKLLKKQEYSSKDFFRKKRRKSKYLLYEPVR